MPFVPSKDKVADIFTKGLAKTNFESLVCKLGCMTSTNLSLRESVKIF